MNFPIGAYVEVQDIPGILWDKLEPGMVGKVVSGPYSIIKADSDTVWPSVDVEFEDITAPCAIPLLALYECGCDVDFACPLHRDIPPEYEWMRGVARGSYGGEMTASEKQDMRDAGRGAMVRA